MLELLATGKSNAELAKQLYLGEGTIKTHVSHLLGKLGVRDRVQAVVFAYESGVVEPGQARDGREPQSSPTELKAASAIRRVGARPGPIPMITARGVGYAVTPRVRARARERTWRVFGTREPVGAEAGAARGGLGGAALHVAGRRLH